MRKPCCAEDAVSSMFAAEGKVVHSPGATPEHIAKVDRQIEPPQEALE